MKTPETGGRFYQLRRSGEDKPTSQEDDAREIVRSRNKGRVQGRPVDFKSEKVRERLDRASVVTLEKDTLAIGQTRIKITQRDANALTLCEPQKKLLSALWSTLRGPDPLLVSADEGSGAEYT